MHIVCLTTEHNIETLEYSGFVDTLGARWFLPSIQTAVDFIEKQKSLNPQAGKRRDVNISAYCMMMNFCF